MRSILFVMLTMGCSGAGCGPSLSQVQDRERCYDKAEAETQKRVDAECSGSFSTCPVRDAIMDELRQKQEACP